MKSLLIERVVNGWLVRPFSPCAEWARGERVETHVYIDMKDLQGALPELLKETNGVTTNSTT